MLFLVFLISFHFTAPILFFSEHKSVQKQIEDFNGFFPEESLVLMDPGWAWQKIALIQHYFYEKDALPNLDLFRDEEAVLEIAAVFEKFSHWKTDDQDMISLLNWKMDRSEEYLRKVLAGYEDVYVVTQKKNPPFHPSFQDTNLMGLLAWQIPSVVAATSATPLPKLRGPVITEVSSGWVLLSYVLALALLSLLWVSFYFAALAHALRNEVAAAASLARRAFLGWLSFSLFFALLLVLLMVAGGALVLVLGVASLFGSGVVALITSVVTALGLAASFYLFFVDDAIFVLEVWPRRAVWYSVSVVWRNFWPSLGFVVLVNLVITGTALVWGYLLQNPFGLAGAVLGHAYITTGFAAAGMLFFAQRYALWQQEAVPGGPS